MRTTAAAVAALLCLFVATSAAPAAEIHVAVTGDDAAAGTASAPVRTIQCAADRAQPGDVVTVHAGIYRERVSPPRGGESDTKRIVYQAAPGEKVEIRGSQIARGWTKVRDDVWRFSTPNSRFGGFNPFADLIRGDWFMPKDRAHHTGAVYLDGEWLIEAATRDQVVDPAATAPLWFAEVDKENTTIVARFKGVDPNEKLIETNARRTCFYPEKTGISYLTVRGFIMKQAATPWAPPTAEQIGVIGTHWSRGWIIEQNVISHSSCSGIALGKYGDEFDNTSANTAEGYVATIDRALKNGWNKETVGGHIVRNNEVSHCEQAGIVGSLGAAFSTVTGNTIHDIHVRRLFTGAEMAGIKFHGAIDAEISHNRIYRTCMGLWLDWMAQGTRVSGNLFHDNDRDLFVEVNHGPFVVDNNLFLSPASLLNYSHGGAYAHNLFAGSIQVNAYDARQTPFHKAHSTALAGMHDNPAGDDRYYNNVFLHPADLSAYDAAKLPCFMDGNLFLQGAKPSRFEANPATRPAVTAAPGIELTAKDDGIYLELPGDDSPSASRARKLVTTDTLGEASVPHLPYEKPDGTPIRIDADYLGRPRDVANPAPGPFEPAGGWSGGPQTRKVW